MKEKDYYRMMPCPAYDIKRLEGWLSDMASKGFLLRKEGIWGNLGIFRKGEPQKQQYFLLPANAKPELLLEADISGHWEYVASNNYYDAYSAAGHVSRLHNEELKDAMGLVRKRARNSVIFVFAWLALFPIFQLRDTFLLTAIDLSNLGFLFLLVLFLFLGIRRLRQYLHIRRLHRRLQADEALNHGNTCKGKQHFYRFRCVAFSVVIAALFLSALIYNGIRLNTEPQKLNEYTKALPFATMRELIPEDARLTMLYDEENTISVGADLLIPQIIDYREVKQVKMPNGTNDSNILEIQYYETAGRWLAREIAREWQIKDRTEYNHWEKREVKDLGVDYSAAYVTNRPILIIQHQNKVMRIAYDSTGAIESWAKVCADAIR